MFTFFSWPDFQTELILNFEKGNIDTDTLFVGNLPEDVDEEKQLLKENFELKPKEIRVVKEKHVAFETNEARSRQF